MTAKNPSDLIEVAMGRQAADIVIRNGTWVCVQSGEFIPNINIAIKDGKIAYVGPDASQAIKEGTWVIEAEEKFLVPGLLDGHMHVESSMLTVTEFSRSVLPHGTTGIFIDPHEIANVFGLKGVRLMADEAIQQPIHVWVQVPSCVPSSPMLETSGGEITPDDVAVALTWERVIGLGEMMNYHGVALGDKKSIIEINLAMSEGKVVGGHYAGKELGLPFHGYAAGGPEDDHEGTTPEDAFARIRQGMKVMLRYGSAWQDVANQAQVITKSGIDSRHFILCTDDSQAETLVSDGHMDRVIRHAIAEGIPAMTAIQMSTINTAEHFGVAREVGQIAPGRWADILVVDDLQKFQIQMVIAKGQVAAINGDLLLQDTKINYPEWVYHSVILRDQLKPDDFSIPLSNESPLVQVNVIGILENHAPTRHLSFKIAPDENEININKINDCAKLAIVERHHKTGIVQVGLVSGFGFTEACAVASTVAHDTHNMIVVGTNEEDMCLAANTLAEIGGGQIVVKKGKVIGLIKLPIGGIISDQPASEVAIQAKTILDGFISCGCNLNNPNMTLSLLSLVVIPELRLSDKGLVDVNNFTFIPVIQDLKQNIDG